MIKGEKISWKYNQNKASAYALKDVSFEIRKGRITTFMGQSGAGKTTLLKCIANLHPNYDGIMTCDGQDIKNLNCAKRASTVGFVLQQFHLFPHLSVLKNCTHALVHVQNVTEWESEIRAIEILDALSMQPFMHAFPAQLSGGQQQRVAIARALVLRPEILLLDEPTSALDPESKHSLEQLLLDLSRQGITLALSSHDMPFIRKIMDYVYFMEQGELIEAWDRKRDDLASSKKIKQFLSHI